MKLKTRAVLLAGGVAWAARWRNSRAKRVLVVFGTAGRARLVAAVLGGAGAARVVPKSRRGGSRASSRPRSRFGRIVVLVNNAGIIGPTAVVTEVSPRTGPDALRHLTFAFPLRPSCSHMAARRKADLNSPQRDIKPPLRRPTLSRSGMIGLSPTLPRSGAVYNIRSHASPGRCAASAGEVIRRRAGSRPYGRETEREYLCGRPRKICRARSRAATAGSWPSRNDTSRRDIRVSSGSGWIDEIMGAAKRGIRAAVTR